MKITVIDTETTGFPETEGGAAIVEVGWCDVLIIDGQASIPTLAGSYGSQLCNPGRPIPPEAMAIHHIRDAEVALMPSPEEVLDRVLVGTADLFASHNADFEQKFIQAPKPWLCTYKAALRVWPDLPHHGNQFLRYALQLQLADEARAMPPHRAGPDAWVSAHLLVALIQSGKASIDDMVRWSTGPALMQRINFGKHKGKRWDEVPDDYLQWIADKSDMDRDAKSNARYWMRKRFEQHDPTNGSPS